jgi:c-di-GMP-related signal transduction protein
METPLTLDGINSALDEAMEQRVSTLERELDMRNSLIQALQEENNSTERIKMASSIWRERGDKLQAAYVKLALGYADLVRENSEFRKELRARNEQIADLQSQVQCLEDEAMGEDQ